MQVAVLVKTCRCATDEDDEQITRHVFHHFDNLANTKNSAQR